MDFIHKIAGLRSLSTGQWISTVNDHVPGIMSAALVIAIAWYLALFLWALVPLQGKFDWSVRSTATVQSGGSGGGSGQVDFRAIAAAHLFGEAGAEPLVNTAIEAPETRLNLKLRGTIAAGSSDLAHAIIADGKGTDDVYFINDTVPGGAKLHEVYPDRVILNRAGTLETLRLPRLSESLGKPATSRSTATTRRPAGTIQEMMTEGPASFTEVLRPQPYMPNGELKGYRVYPGRDRRKFAALGLRPGDLVTEINGQPMNNMQSGMEIFRNLGNASQITVTIERNGSPINLTLDTAQFTTPSGSTR